MKKIRIMNNNKNTAKELRKFAVILFCALGFLGGLVLWRREEAGLLFWGIGIAILLAGLFEPKLLAPLYKGWMGLSFLMGFLVTHLILALMYYLIFTPVGLLMRALGRDPLRFKFDQNAETYWIKKDQAQFSREKYERMF